MNDNGEVSRLTVAPGAPTLPRPQTGVAAGVVFLMYLGLEYLEIFHNRQRRHSALGTLTPVEYEMLYPNVQSA
ncbi:hypothetical protein [Streptosporangium sp. NPDC023615]|uniref:hypothetical protein n=1 Tax=Streptosporangium sp. NPDC023615 TaxID=3154794 RepID=UPI00342C20A8